MHLRMTQIPILVLVLVLTSISSILPVATLAQDTTSAPSGAAMSAGVPIYRGNPARNG